MEQRNNIEQNDQNDEHGKDEHDDNRPLTNEHQEKDDQEESNVVSALRMAQKMQTMKEKMDMMMSALKGRVSTSLDELVHHIDSPFTVLITFFPFLANFRIPQVEAYNRLKFTTPVTSFSLQCIKSFKTLMHLKGVSNEIMCRAFPTTLKGPTRVWFNKLTPNTVSTFKELNGHFVIHFIGRQRYKRFSVSLLNIKQWEDESLRSYVTRFNKEAVLINEADNKILITAFTNGLQSKEFLFAIYKNDLKIMADMLYKATKYMNVEDAIIAYRGMPKKRER